MIIDGLVTWGSEERDGLLLLPCSEGFFLMMTVERPSTMLLEGAFAGHRLSRVPGGEPT
jgi:hypothetical protein